MSTDPCLDAALAYSRRSRTPSRLVRFWNWYKRVTGYEKAMLQRRTGLRIQSTAFPSSDRKPRVGSIIDQIMGAS